MPNILLHTQITLALDHLRMARAQGNAEVIVVAERHFDRLCDRLNLVSV